MDKSVLQAIERWPNVPAVFGWLSLTARGQWRLHPDGQAMHGSTGESISNPQILSFIDRNYACDDRHRWFFQNGPQRVYVRLDAAPWIINADNTTGALTTHTGLAVQRVKALAIDDAGHLYLETEHGYGLLIDRDLSRFIEHGTTAQGLALDSWSSQSRASTPNTTVTNLKTQWQACEQTLPLRRLATEVPIDQQLQFVANPMPDTD
jgi:hypothetical protein